MDRGGTCALCRRTCNGLSPQVNREGASISEIRKLPPFEVSLGATLLGAKEAVIAPLRTILREYNVTEPQWRVMRVINDRGLTDATGLAETSLLRAPSVTRILKELEERKLIIRKTDPDDRRRMLVALSETGQAFVQETAGRMVRLLNAYSERFGSDRLDALANELRALSDSLEGLQ